MDLEELIKQSGQQYPFIARHNPIISLGQGEGYAETWPIGEEGAPDQFGNPTRPAHMPLNRLGIEIYRPNEFSPQDLAGEVLHVDPLANRVRTIMNSSLSPQQWDILKREALDYDESIRQGLSEERARENTIDSAIRGYAVNQWPEQINRDLKYTQEQRDLLDALKYYMQTSKEPSAPTLRDVYKEK